MATLLRVLHDEAVPLRTSAAAVAQVWRRGDRQTNFVRFLNGVDVVPLDEPAARQVGALLAISRTSDVVDGHIALLAEPGGDLLTSDLPDLRALFRARKVKARLVAV